MDIKAFLKLIKRYKLLLILVPVVAVTITYFLVQNLPKEYKSLVEMSTGLLDPSKKVISEETVDFFKVSQQIASIMEKLQMKKTINMVSYNLAIHDLEQPQKKFKEYSKKVDSLSQTQRKEILELYKDKLSSKSLLTLADDKGKYKLYSIIESMGYGENDLRKKLDITHADNSDFISIVYTSENPDLSAFVVNTLATGFISDYMLDVSNGENSSIALLDSLVKRKEAVMNRKNDELASFKRANGVLNLTEQASGVDAQITKYEGQRADLLLQIDQNQAALDVINAKLKGVDVDVPSGNSRVDNSELITIRSQLQAASNNYVDRPTVANRRRVDSLTTLLNTKRNQNSNENIVNPLTSKQNLVAQKNAIDVTLGSERASFKTIDAELTSLRAKFNSMVPYDADIQNKERDAELATKDYTASLDSYNASKTNQNVSSFRLQIDQAGLPENAEPSKRMLYIAGAGIGSFVLSLGFLLVLFALDSSINNLGQLERATKSKAIGALNKINNSDRHIREIWNDKSNQNVEIFRDLLRALRFEIRSKMDNDNKKILGITSLVAGEGKTFIAHGLAYAFAMTGKKILLITDALSVVKSDSKELAHSQDFAMFLMKKEINTEDLITILNKDMVQSSLLESQSIKNLQNGFEVLKKEFDMIIIDINSLHNLNIAKEWLLFTETNVAVFEAGRSLEEHDMELVNYIKNKPDFLGWIMNKMEFEKK